VGRDPVAVGRLDDLEAFVESQARGLLIIRHSIRGPIPKHPDRRDVPITDEGRQLAEHLGTRWRLPIRDVFSSPMIRCRDTAACFLEGARRRVPIETTSRLGDPGPFVVDSSQAWDNYFRLGKHELVTTMLERPGSLSGYRPSAAGVALLLDELVPAHGHRLAFSHDLIMALIIGWTRRKALVRPEWPGFCEGLWLARHGDDAHVWYRGEHSVRSTTDAER
jgi:broad specificity phosphatase PhoE